MTVNGKQVKTEETMTISEFLKRGGYEILHVAVEKNGAVIPKKLFETETVGGSDRLEIVQFVGGG